MIRGAAVLVILVAGATSARAEPSMFVNAGPLVSNTWYAKDLPEAVGIGAEVSVVKLDMPTEPFELLVVRHVGAFAQAEAVGIGAGDDDAIARWHLRAAAGAQAGFGPFGLELGADVQTGDEVSAGGLDLHVAGFFAFGPGAIAVRGGAPLLPFESRGSYGWELTVRLTVKALVRVRPKPTKVILPFGLGMR